VAFHLPDHLFQTTRTNTMANLGSGPGGPGPSLLPSKTTPSGWYGVITYHHTCFRCSKYRRNDVAVAARTALGKLAALHRRPPSWIMEARKGEGRGKRREKKDMEERGLVTGGSRV